MSKILYIVGSFTTVSDANGAHARNRAAALDVETALFTSWNPNLNGQANCVTVDASGVYIGGGFTTVGGIARNGLAKVDKATGALDGTFASVIRSGSSAINCLKLSGSYLYMGGGFFETAPATFKRGPMKVNATTGALDPWFGDVGGAGLLQLGLTVIGTNIYCGGDFSQVNVSSTPLSRSRMAAWDLTTNVLQAFNPDTGNAGTVSTVQNVGGDLAAGGNYGTSSLQHLRKHNATSGAVLAYDGLGNSSPLALLDSGGALYAVGSFTSLAGAARSRAAALDDVTAAALAFDPNLTGGSNFAKGLAVGNGLVYIGGAFILSNGVSRINLAIFNPAGALQ